MVIPSFKLKTTKHLMYQDRSTDFQDILQGCYRDQRSSQNALYRLFYPYGMSIAIRYVNTEAEAMSIVNDTFLKVFKNIKRYDTQLEFKPWFRKILVNTAINYMKKEKKYKEVLNLETIPAIATQEDILSKLNYKDLIKILKSLSLAYRTVFNLYVIEGYKHEEIANMLGISVSTSKSNLTRARVKLRELVIVNLKQSI